MINRSVHARRPIAAAQAPRRQAEAATRRRVVALARASDLSAAAAARSLGLAERAVGSWVRARRISRRAPGPVLRGRPPTPVDPGVEVQIKEVLASHGRGVGVPALKGLFPRVPRSALRTLRDRALPPPPDSPCEQLDWTTPGVAWSTDYTEAPNTIDGSFRQILLVRDLASQCTLLSLPCAEQSARTVGAQLAELFVLYGAPLVIKSDNGSPFIAGLVGEQCDGAGVVHLRSPPLTPGYNGSIESTGGCLKARAAHIAACSGRSGCWSSDDLEAARRSANEFNRPWGVRSPTPAERWQGRRPITQTERDRFLEAVQEHRLAITRSWLARLQSQPRAPHDRGAPATPQHCNPSPARADQPAPPPELPAELRPSVGRAAIRQALVGLGYLTIRRPAITSTHSPSKLGRN